MFSLAECEVFSVRFSVGLYSLSFAARLGVGGVTIRIGGAVGLRPNAVERLWSGGACVLAGRG